MSRLHFARRVAALGTIALALAGCDRGAWRDHWDMRYGPRQAFHEGDVDVSNNHQYALMKLFRERAGYGDRQALTSDEWYVTMLAGMSYIDEVCDAYLQELSILDREKSRALNLLATGTAVTAAVLQSTGAGAKAIALVAQAFLLTKETTEIVAGSYMYRLPPGTILNVTRALRKGYRTLVAEKRSVYGTQFAAYAGVRGYVLQCMPVTIDAKIDDILKTAKFAYEPGDAALLSTNGFFAQKTRPTRLRAPTDQIPVMDVPVRVDPK